mgnify:CR=1 FL=1
MVKLCKQGLEFKVLASKRDQISSENESPVERLQYRLIKR